MRPFPTCADCPERATDICDLCDKDVCNDHIVGSGRMVVCIDCRRRIQP